ncbi:unnamed protein product [Schistosoma intercalatum]|nr:unnamed protein product [Schistosoma intercalatum]
MRFSRYEFKFLVVVWLSLLPVLMFCITVYFRKKTFSKTELCREGLVDNVSITSEGVDWITDEISHSRLFDLSESVLIKEDQIKNVDRIGISHETLRRRALNYVHEARYTLNNLRNIFTQLKKVNQKELDTETVSSIQASLVRYRQNMEETITHLQTILNKLGELDEFSQIRKNGLNKLSQRLQEKIQKQQNPSDCKKAKYVTLDFTNLCGLGCRMHQLMYCLQLALENERVFVLKKHHSGDPFREWLHQSMLPLSDKCSYLDSDNRSDNIECPLVRKAFTDPKWLPYALPIDMSEELLRLHEAPFVWFGGQLAAYIMRLKPQLAQLINVTLKSFKTSGDPVVGVHIRRTDKLVLEAKFHDLSEYMEHVDNFFDLQSVNLLTMSKRHVCRLAYELMQTRHMDLGDATQLFHSIDKFYHQEDYGRLKFDVIIPDMKVKLKYGDVVEIRQINWNGSVLVKPQQSSENIHNKNREGMENEFIAPAYRFRPKMNMTGFN